MADTGGSVTWKLETENKGGARFRVEIWCNAGSRKWVSDPVSGEAPIYAILGDFVEPSSDYKGPHNLAAKTWSTEREFKLPKGHKYLISSNVISSSSFSTISSTYSENSVMHVQRPCGPPSSTKSGICVVHLD